MQANVRRYAYLTGGILAVALGLIGAFLPIMPTVPFLLVAVFCFSKSHPAWEQRLLDHPRYGPPIRLWRERGAIGRMAKIGASIAFAGSVVLGLWLTPWPWPLIPIGVAVICGGWIWTRPER